ncbi:MAG: UDP-N-acetylmuramoyl-L-alanyl-D-glutamate--2,6-diaminopimelate ligase, partial [Bacteroidetes bacterium]|nr:UDP-N-acetylmuramoyl-L-alanyl-D-glutamate--2,6-diaminopimelate ligase [Bacteroidota bacterium]
ILAEIQAGLQNPSAATTLPNRAEAIATAVAGSAPGDIVVVAGKGHEDYQIIGTEKRPFDDRVHLKKALLQRPLTADR